MSITRVQNLNASTTVGRTDVVPMGPANNDPVVKVQVQDLIRLPEYTVATLPTADADTKRDMAYVSDGAGGSPVIAFCDGSNWLRLDTLASIA